MLFVPQVLFVAQEVSSIHLKSNLELEVEFINEENIQFFDL